jgi:hypothetical protein
MSIEERLKKLPHNVEDQHGLLWRYTLAWNRETSQWTHGYHAEGTSYDLPEAGTLEEAVADLELNVEVLRKTRGLKA